MALSPRLRAITCKVVLPLALSASQATAQPAVRPEVRATEAEIATKRQEIQTLLDELQSKLATLPPLPPQRSNESRALRDQRQKREEMQRIVAELERRMNADGEPPKRLTSSETPAVYAYGERLLKRITEYSERKRPRQDGRPVYGKVTLVLTLDAKGQISQIEVADSTSKFLSSHSRQLIHELAPFEPFPSELTRLAGLLVVKVPFNFPRN